MQNGETPRQPELRVIGGASDRVFTGLLAAATLLLLGVHFLAAHYWEAPGHLSIDEGTYHMMAKSFAAHGGVWIWNGYEEFPSKELEVRISEDQGRQVTAHGGRLVAAPPHLYAVLAFPFYRLAGYRGLFLLNSLAFLGVVGLCYATAMELFRDRALALGSAFLFAFGTFAWEYSQAAWPHMTALFFELAAFYGFVRAFRTESPRSALGFSLASGAIAGFAVGIRLDAILLLPAIAFPLLFSRPAKLRAAIAFLAGCVPGLTALAWTNQLKFGAFVPLSYGGGTAPGVARYLSFALVGVGVLALAWSLSRRRARAFFADRRYLAVAAGLCLALGVALVPQLRDVVWRTSRGAYELGVDLRAYQPPLGAAAGRTEPGMSRTPRGAVVYMERVKKALLQSCPYLVALLVPLVAIARKREHGSRMALLFPVPLAFFAFYAYSSWHGGLSLNLRYLLPALPFTSILCAYAARQIARHLDRRWLSAAGFASAGTAVFYLGLAAPWATTLERQEVVYLQLPLLLALLLAVLLGIALSLPEKRRAPVAGAASLALASCVTWAGLVGFFYDYPQSWELRTRNFEIGNEAAKLVRDDSLVMTTYADRMFALLQKPRIRIARPSLDRHEDFEELARFHLGAGRPVYLILSPEHWLALRRMGLFDGFEVTVMKTNPTYVLGRMEAS